MHTSIPTVYRAQFPFTYKEMHEDRRSDMKTVIPSVILLMAISVWLSTYLRNTSESVEWFMLYGLCTYIDLFGYLFEVDTDTCV